jgi:Na+/phosphate symporter
MTNYDKLIDAISDEIYHYLLSVSQPSWNEEEERKHLEEFWKLWKNSNKSDQKLLLKLTVLSQSVEESLKKSEQSSSQRTCVCCSSRDARWFA